MKPSAIYLITWAWLLRRSDCGDNTAPDLRTHLNNTGSMCSVTALGPGGKIGQIIVVWLQIIQLIPALTHQW